VLNVLQSNTDRHPSIAHSGPVARVLVAVGNDVARAGLRSLLSAMPGLERVGEAFDAQRGLALARRLAPDLVLLDADLGQHDRFGDVRTLSATHPNIRVLVVSMFADFDLLLQAVDAGAVGFIRLGTDLAEIERGISAALAGELAVDARMAAEAVRRLAQVDQPGVAPAEHEQPVPNPLSPREHQVLALLVRGYSNREIARDLVITAHTAKVHVEHILAKLKVRCRTEAAVRAIEFGYVTA
jgi:DNA-binding NarL/FixJ family response regulator